SFRSGNSDIYVMNTDGSGVIQLTDDPATDFGDRAGWSPDGRRFVFSSSRDGGDIDIFVMNADGTGVTRLTHNDFIADDAPAWPPWQSINRQGLAPTKLITPPPPGTTRVPTGRMTAAG